MTNSPSPTKCPACEASLGIPASAAGKTVRCPRCKKPFKVPAVATAVAAPIPEPPAEEDEFDFFSDTPDDDRVDDEQAQVARFWVVDTSYPPRSYRLYVAGDKLVCVYVGDERLPTGWWLRLAIIGAIAGGFAGLKGTLKGGDLAEIATAVAGGAGVGALAGAPAGALLGLLLSPFRDYEDKKHAKRMAQLDKKPLSVLRMNHENNFVIKARDIENAEIVGPSFWFRGIPHVALLKLSLREQNDRVLALPTRSNVRPLAQALHEMTGHKVPVRAGM